MLDVDLVWARVSGAPGPNGKKGKRHPLIPPAACLHDYKFLTFNKQVSLTTQQTQSNLSQDFPAGAIILSLGMAAAFAAQAASAVRGTLDQVRISVTYPAADGVLITVAVNAAAILGRNNEKQWPEKEVIIPSSGSLTYSLTNLTTSTLDVDVAWNALVLKAAAA